MTNHPITPPPELVQQWRKSGPADAAVNNAYERHIATQAARWGADQELLACGNYLEKCAAWEPEDVTEFYNYRRPKPLSPRELALATLRKLSTSGYPCNLQQDEDWDTIRQALEQLDD